MRGKLFDFGLKHDLFFPKLFKEVLSFSRNLASATDKVRAKAQVNTSAAGFFFAAPPKSSPKGRTFFADELSPSPKGRDGVGPQRSLFLIPFIILILFLATQSQAKNYPQDYFRNPVEIPITLAGSFGELRFNHFHSGFDIRTNGAEGMPVYAAADGWISRIRVQGFNYGNCLHISHPNGYTTLYGHMQRFSKEIQQFVKEEQYRTESFEQDIHPDSEKFMVKKGQLIGYSGNSGASRAPHLHFEIRETITEACINPMLFMKSQVVDNIPPVIKGIKIYPLDSHSMVRIYSKKGMREAIYGQGIIVEVSHQKGGKFVLSGVSKIEASGTIGFAIRAVDYYSDHESTLAPYAISLNVDKKNIYSQKLEKVDFSKQHFLNAHTDYAEFVKFNKWYERSYCLPNDSLDIYTNLVDRGKITVNANREIQYVVSDMNDSSAILSFTVNKTDNTDISAAKKEKEYDCILPYNKENKFENANFKLNIPDRSLYDNMAFSYDTEAKKGKAWSDIFKVQDAYVPFIFDCDVSIKADNLPERLYSKACICSDMRGYLGGTCKGGWVRTGTKALGDFHVATDTTPPMIHPINIREGAKLGGKNSVIFTISDNLSGIRSFRATIDDKWVLLKCDTKKSKYWYDFDEHCSKGAHTFKITVTDNRDNTRTEEWKFTR